MQIDKEKVQYKTGSLVTDTMPLDLWKVGIFDKCQWGAIGSFGEPECWYFGDPPRVY